MDQSHDAVVGFYKEALKDLADIKFRDWPDATYIEDDGKRQWHSITISKEDQEGTTIFHKKSLNPFLGERLFHFLWMMFKAGYSRAVFLEWFPFYA